MNTDLYRNVVVLFANGIGDHFITLPTIRALQKIFADRLILLCPRDSYTPDFFDARYFKNIVAVDFWDDDDGLRRFDVEQAVLMTRCDLFIHLCPWMSPDVTMFIERSGCQASVGGYAVFDHYVPFNHREHVSRLFFEVPRFFDSTLTLEAFTSPPVFTYQGISLDAYLHTRFGNLSPKLVIHNETAPEKQWRTDYLRTFIDLARAANPNLTVMCVGVHPMALQEDVIQVNGVPLPVACAMILQADYYLGVDSSFTHLVALTDIPAIGLFGPTASASVGLRHANQINLQAINNDVCRITPHVVFQEFQKLTLLSRTSKSLSKSV